MTTNLQDAVAFHDLLLGELAQRHLVDVELHLDHDALHHLEVEDHPHDVLHAAVELRGREGARRGGPRQGLRLLRTSDSDHIARSIDRSITRRSVC